MKRRNLEAVRRMFAQPLLMHPRYAASLYRRVMDHPGEMPMDDEVEVPEVESESSVLVVPIRGTIVHHMTDAYDMGGGLVTPTEMLISILDAAEADDSVSGVVLNIDSGGGMAAGTPEAAERIYRFRESGKPIIAVANSFAASAAYYLGAAASEFHVTPSGEVGSVGTLMIHEDVSELFEKMGVKVEILRASEAGNKARFNPFEPLSDEEREHAIAQLDTINGRFLADVARFRGLDAESMAKVSGNGRTFLAEAAMEAGLVDGVKTLREVLAEMEAAHDEDEPMSDATRTHSISDLKIRISVEADTPERSLPEGGEVRLLDDMEVRAVDGQTPKLEGVALRYGSRSVDLGGFVEEFTADAFAGSLESDDLRVLWQHDGRYVFGRVRAGTARIWSEGGALRYEATPPNAQWAKDAMESIRRGDVNQNSFAFRVEKGGERWERRDGFLVRTVSKATLIEVGPQTNAAYADTSVAVRGMQAFITEERRLETNRKRLALAKSKMVA